MEKILEKLKVLVVILFVIFVSLIAFWGVFSKEKGVWKNVIPDYQYAMEMEGTRELRYVPDNSEEEQYVYVDENGNIMGEVWENGSAITEEHEKEHEEGIEEDNLPYAKETRTVKVNNDDKLTKENFETAKRVIQERLKKQEIAEANLRIDDVTGNLMVETGNHDKVELVESLISSAGKFQIIDYQNGLVLMDNADIKNVSVVSSNEASYNTYLQIEFNKKGSEKLKEISTKYVEIENDTETEETTEEHNHDEETEKKYVSIVFDNTTMMTTYFGEEMTAGILQISVGQARTDYEEFLEDYRSAKSIADILNSGVMPITYELETDNFVKSEWTNEDFNTLKIAGTIIVAIISLILIIKFKKNGILAAILGVGYIAILSIIIRYTNVVLTESSMLVYEIIIIMNYIFMKMVLKRLQTQEIGQAYNEVAKKFYLSSIPVIVIAIIFTFSKYVSINSIGMILFWGIVLNVLYHILLTRMILKNKINRF